MKPAPPVTNTRVARNASGFAASFVWGELIDHEPLTRRLGVAGAASDEQDGVSKGTRTPDLRDHNPTL